MIFFLQMALLVLIVLTALAALLLVMVTTTRAAGSRGGTGGGGTGRGGRGGSGGRGRDGSGRGRDGSGRGGSGRGRLPHTPDIESSDPDLESPATDSSRRRSISATHPSSSSRPETPSASGSVPPPDAPAGTPSVTAGWAPEYPRIQLHPATDEYIRGPTDPPTPPERPIGENRRELWPAGDTFFPYDAARILGQIIRENYHGPYLNFSEVPQNMQYVWLEEMKTTFWWPPHRDELIRKAYKAAAGKKIRDAVYDVRTAHSRKKWLREEYYEQMLDKMNTAQYREKSEKAKASRQAAGLHTGGSKPHAATRADLAKRAVKEGREPESVTAYDVFLHTHKRRADGSFVDARARATDAAYREALSQIEPPAEVVGETTPTQTPSSMAASYDDVFVESVGGFNKGRVYGVGSLAASLQGATPRYPPPPSPPAPPSDDMRTQLATLTSDMSEMRSLMSDVLERLPRPSSAPGPDPSAPGPSTAVAGPSDPGRYSFDRSAEVRLVPDTALIGLMDMMSPEQLRNLPEHVLSQVPAYMVEEYIRRAEAASRRPRDPSPGK
ncbi:putative acrosin [Iris pallida]|uniref:Acrosin n=1 Tax=Iris pallida TaxID=29817 RepID=A0AAX6HGB8_IRIPA|nr:putative acrosin [Iris pallida]